MRKFFVVVSLNNCKKLIKVLYESELTYDLLENAIKKSFSLFGEIILLTNSGLEIDKEDVIDYINQYSSNPDLVLLLRADEDEDNKQNVENFIIKDESPEEYIAVSTENVQINDRDDTLMLQKFNNFESKEELKEFIEFKLKTVLVSYQKNDFLTNSERISLSKSIIKHMVDSNPQNKFTRQHFENLSKFIKEIFPKETETTYYKKHCEGKVASGKLWDAYNNYRRKLAKLGIIQRKSRSRTASSSLASTHSSNSVLDTDDIDNSGAENDFVSLETYIQGDALERKWRNTFDLRKKLLKTNISSFEYIKKFPALEQSEGYKLFAIDTELKYGKRSDFSIERKYFEAILQKAEKSSHKRAKEFLNLISQETNDLYKKILSLLILPFLLPTTNVKRVRKTLTRPSKIEVQESFIVHYNSFQEADSCHRKFIENSSESVQPRLLLIGSPLEAAILHVAHLKYAFNSLQIKKALEACMNAFLALNLEYPTGSFRVWYFLQKHIFKINTPYDKLDSSVETLHNDLNC